MSVRHFTPAELRANPVLAAAVKAHQPVTAERATHAAQVSARNSAATRAGRSFQDELEHDHAIYRARGWGYLQPAQLATTWVKGVLTPAGKSGPDYIGVHRTIPVAFDAKSMRVGQSYRCKDLDRRRGSDRYQLEALQAHHAGGGLSFLLVRDETLSRVYAIGAEFFAHLLSGGSVGLREPMKDGGAPVLPCVTTDPRTTVQRLAAGRPVWEWPTLFPEIPR